MTLTKRRPAVTTSHLRSRSRQRILPKRPLRLQRARSFAWAVAGDAMGAVGAVAAEQLPTQETASTSLTCTVTNTTHGCHSPPLPSVLPTKPRRLPSSDLLFRYIERVSLRKLSRTGQHSSPLAGPIDTAAITTTPSHTGGIQTPSLSTMAMRHGQRRWCLVRQCLVKARALALSREMQRGELHELERLGIVNAESVVLGTTKQAAATTATTTTNNLEENHQEESATADSWWIPTFPEEREALQLWWATAHEMEMRESPRQCEQRQSPLPTTPLHHPVPTIATGSPRSPTVCCTDNSDKDPMDHITKPPSPPLSPPAILPRRSNTTTTLS